MWRTCWAVCSGLGYMKGCTDSWGQPEYHAGDATAHAAQHAELVGSCRWVSDCTSGHTLWGWITMPLQSVTILLVAAM